MIKTILHLCADIGSDSYPYQQHPDYNVILVGKDIGVENYSPPSDVYGVIANPVCTNFSIAKNANSGGAPDLSMVEHCMRIIEECNPAFWVLENPATGALKNYIGQPAYSYEPWWYGSPWTKKTALWGKFNIPPRIFHNWDDVQKNNKLWVRKGRKTSLVWLHKSAVRDIDEFAPFADKVDSDMALRSLCSQGFANAFFKANR